MGFAQKFLKKEMSERKNKLTEVKIKLKKQKPKLNTNTINKQINFI